MQSLHSFSPQTTVLAKERLSVSGVKLQQIHEIAEWVGFRAQGEDRLLMGGAALFVDLQYFEAKVCR